MYQLRNFMERSKWVHVCQNHVMWHTGICILNWNDNGIGNRDIEQACVATAIDVFIIGNYETQRARALEILKSESVQPMTMTSSTSQFPK